MKDMYAACLCWVCDSCFLCLTIMFTCIKYVYAVCLCWVCILWRNVCGSCHVVFPSIPAAQLCLPASNTCMQFVYAGFVSCGVMFVAPAMLFFLQSLLRVFDACQDAAAADASRQPVLFLSVLCSRAPNTRMKLVCAGFVSCGVMFVAPACCFSFNSCCVCLMPVRTPQPLMHHDNQYFSRRRYVHVRQIRVCSLFVLGLYLVA